MVLNEEPNASLNHDGCNMIWHTTVTRLRISRPLREEGDDEDEVPLTQPTFKKDDEFIHKSPVGGISLVVKFKLYFHLHYL